MPSVAQLALSMIQSRRAERTAKTLEVVKPYSPHPPSEKQKLFLDLDAEECFYGGAAGGGKSDALILAALQYVDVPEYSAIILRAREVDLVQRDGIQDRAATWFEGTRAWWDGNANAWRFPSGATISFGFGRSKAELEFKYSGPAFQFVGFDELPTFPEEAYLFMFSRLRRLHKFAQVPLRMRGAGNPGGRGREWILRRFVEFAKHESGATVRDNVAAHKARRELPQPQVFRSPPSTQALAVAREYGREAQGAYFIPAYAEDNPGLDVPSYKAQLSRLDTASRDMLEHGDWWSSGGGKFFQEQWFKYADAPPPFMRTIRFWDQAATEAAKGKEPDWTAGARVGVENIEDQSMFWVTHVTRFQESPAGNEKRIKSTAETDTKRVHIYMEQEPGSSGKNNIHNYASRVLFGWTFMGIPSSGAKEDFWKPMASDAQNGLVTLVRGDWNEEFVRELCALTSDDSHANDDMADAAAKGLAILVEKKDLLKLRAWR